MGIEKLATMFALLRNGQYFLRTIRTASLLISSNGSLHSFTLQHAQLDAPIFIGRFLSFSFSKFRLQLLLLFCILLFLASTTFVKFLLAAYAITILFAWNGELHTTFRARLCRAGLV